VALHTCVVSGLVLVVSLNLDLTSPEIRWSRRFVQTVMPIREQARSPSVYTLRICTPEFSDVPEEIASSGGLYADTSVVLPAYHVFRRLWHGRFATPSTQTSDGGSRSSGVGGPSL